MRNVHKNSSSRVLDSQCEYTGKCLASMHMSDPIQIQEQLDKENYPLTFWVPIFFSKKDHIF